MSYEEFRRRIDTARQILVGAVPSPAGQIDQITYALIYKFMNDIDDKSAALGGKRTYFAGDYEKYNWHALMSPSLGSHERLELYRQAIQTMANNPGLPSMFADIYRNAFLPFNSANVLTLFLKEIDKFNHGESDDIGDAYEYLLSITGAQGDVGQFRTPRHIIKFIVEAVNPSKDDSVLDPACGTAGFLIKAYEHVLRQHDGKDADGKPNDEHRLSADELGKLHHNYRGFDIDPTMVRTAKVNLYLHGFKSPDIINHDSLSSEDYWNDKYDVILANPPFMTPKGGIQPHKKFSVSANRAEVLFVDYIMSHLNPVSGRAGIIVPEGIIFQSGKAYKELRKNLVENSLYAVVSLPSGVFNPYAGVKTSILLLDKELAKQRDEILFIKVEKDGFGLGAQRSKLCEEYGLHPNLCPKHSDLPQALQELAAFKSGAELTSQLAHAVKKSEITESGDYNFSGDRYRLQDTSTHADYPTFSLAQLEEDGKVQFLRGSNLSKKAIIPNGKRKCIHYGELYTLYEPVIKEVVSRTDVDSKVLSEIGDVLVPATTTAGPEGIAVARSLNESGVVIGGDINIIRTNNEHLLADYLSWVINYPLKKTLSTYATGVNIYHLSNNDLRKLKVILPPLEIQRQIVDELDGYQRIIDSATAIVKTYKPTIKINPNWEMSNVGEVSEFIRGITFSAKDKIERSGEAVLVATTKAAQESGIVFDDLVPVAPEKVKKDKSYLRDGDLLISVANSANLLGRRTFVSGLDSSKKYSFGAFMGCLRPDTVKILPEYMTVFFESDQYKQFCLTRANTTTNISNLNWSDLAQFDIPLPPLKEQKQIVADLEAEQKLIDSNKKLITLYQQKIRTKIAEVWGE